MTHSSALITDQGARVLLRVGGRIYELSQPELRQVLGLPEGPLGLGITVHRDRFHFEFPGDQRTVEFTVSQLRRRFAKLSPSAI